jgi:hypothetical protein
VTRLVADTRRTLQGAAVGSAWRGGPSRLAAAGGSAAAGCRTFFLLARWHPAQRPALQARATSQRLFFGTSSGGRQPRCPCLAARMAVQGALLWLCSVCRQPLFSG